MLRIGPPELRSASVFRMSVAEKEYDRSHRESVREESRRRYARTSIYSTLNRPLPSIPSEAVPPIPTPPKPQRSKFTTFIIVVAFCLLACAVSLEAVIVSTALPSIQRDLPSKSSDEYAWVGSAYLLVSTSMLPVWARLSDIYGRRPAMVAADIFFIAGSILAALAQDMKILLVGRAVQGLGGGGLLVMINICTTDMFSLRERGMYIAIFGGITAITAAAAPVLGGYFAQDLSWRWCFWLNVPLGSVALILVAIFLDIEITGLNGGLKSIDYLGILTVTGGTVNLLVGLQMGGITHPWSSALVLALIISGGVMFFLFALIQWKISRYPLVPKRILRHPSNLAFLAISFCHGFTYISVVYYLPVYFQLVLNASPIDSGVWLLPTALSMGLATAISGAIVKRWGRYLEITWISLVVAVVGFGFFTTLPDHKDWPRMIAVQILVGCGLGPLFQAPLIGLLSRICSEDIAAANALYAFLRSLGSALSIVVGQVMIQHWLQEQKSNLLQAGVPPPLVAKFTKDFTQLSGPVKSSLPLAQIEAIRHALNTSMRSAWILYTAVAFFACLVAFLIPREGLATKPGSAWEELEDR